MKIKNVLVILKYIIIIIVIVFSLAPIFYTVISSFKTLGQIYDTEQIMSLKNLSLDTWRKAIETAKFLLYFRNSVIITLISTLIVMIFAIPASYGLAKLKMSKRMRENISFEFLSMRMLPGIAVIVPIFVIYKKIGLIYTIPGLIIMYIVFNAPLAVWLLEGFFKELSTEIIEAGRIDGCSAIYELFKIAIPLTGPGILSISIITFIFIWNEYMFASVLTISNSRTLPFQPQNPHLEYTAQLHSILACISLHIQAVKKTMS